MIDMRAAYLETVLSCIPSLTVRLPSSLLVEECVNVNVNVNSYSDKPGMNDFTS
jgi:hypothetical protein